MSLLQDMEAIARLGDVPVTAVRTAAALFRLVDGIGDGGGASVSVQPNMSGKCFAVTRVSMRCAVADESTDPARLIEGEASEDFFTELVSLKFTEGDNVVIPATPFNVLRLGCLYVFDAAALLTLSVTVDEPDGFDVLGGATLVPTVTLSGFLLPESAADALSRHTLVRL